MTQQRTVLIHNDALGIEAFKAIKEAILKQTKDKVLLARLERVSAVFDYRTDMAIKIEDTPQGWERRDKEAHLAKTFKKPAFFIDAVQLILDEVREANRAKEEAAAEKRAKMLTTQRSRGWGY